MNGSARFLMSRAVAAFAVLALSMIAMLFGPAGALAGTPKPIVVTPEQDRVEVTSLGELYEGRGDSLQVETAAGGEGTAGRMSVRATTSGTNPNWIVFALSNPSDVAVERWLTADRYTVVGSGAVWPDLDARRIEAVTPSIGFVPERVASDRADVFRITLEPGQTITYVAELGSDRFARIFLWKPLDYELKVRERQLFNGVMLGLTGLLAIFLTAIFAANHKVIFPAAALVAWCALGYLCVDFGFFHKLFQLKPENNAVYRAATEASMAASLVLFLYVFLRIPLWHGLARMLFSVWILAQLALIAVAVIDPRLASTFARVSFVALAVFGGAITLFLALRGQDRALSLVPTWILFAVWVFGAGVALSGQFSGEMVVSGLVAGLVLIVLLLGFTVTQFAFRSLEPMYGTAPSELQLRSVAVEAAGAAVWEWSARRDEVKIGSIIEQTLGLNAGELSTKVDDFCRHLHSADREKFRLSLVATQERGDGRIQTDFRLRHADNSYRWYELEAAPMPSSDGRTIKCVGLLRDVTDAKRAHERLLQNSVNCSLTGLPNRQLFLDRIGLAMQRARVEQKIRPTVIFIDLDKFKSVNTSFGVVVGDSLLLTIARRLQRHLEPQDTLSRVGGDQFAILLLNEMPAPDLASLAERVRRSLRSPIKIAGQEIVLTGSVGIAIYDGQETNDHDLLKEAELAMYRAKRTGVDQIEIFRPEMRGERDDRLMAEGEIRKALEKNQLKVLYQPIVYLPTEELAGFEAIVRWEHPKHGLINPAAFVPADSSSDLMLKIGSHLLARATRDCGVWQKELPRSENPLFVSLNLSGEHILRQELVQDVRNLIGRNIIAKGTLKLEIKESLVLENPDLASELLQALRAAGAEVALDDFGAGYSSIAFLDRFAVETIKIDRGLVQACGGKDGPGAAVVRSIVALAHELGKKVVAEGVEADEDIGFLRSIGCEYAQGFYYGEPIVDRDVLQLLKMVRKSERKMQPRGLFRATAKKQPVKAPGPETSDVPSTNGTIDVPVATPPPAALPPPLAAAHSEAARAIGGLPNSQIRPRVRTKLEPRPVVNGQHGANGAGPNSAAGPNGGYRPTPARPVAVEPMPPSPPPQNGPVNTGTGSHANGPQGHGLQGPGMMPSPPPMPVALAAFGPPSAPPPMPPQASAPPTAPPATAASVQPVRPMPLLHPAGLGVPPPAPPVVANGPLPMPPRTASPQPVMPRNPNAPPNLDRLPPAIAASLQKLAGVRPLKKTGTGDGGS